MSGRRRRRGERSALQTAALIGRVFWGGPVCELVEGADPEFGLLQERVFVLPRARSSIEGQREWLIKHALTREVAYASLLKARRALLHAGFAQWLERNGRGEAEHAPPRPGGGRQCVGHRPASLTSPSS